MEVTRPLSFGKAERTTFIALFAMYLLLILYPILRADRYYSDDLVRALTGFYGWDFNGRHLSMLVMRLLQFNLRQLVDISPLPQLGAIAVLAGTGALISRHYKISSPWLATLVTFPLGAQPFFLENLSYRFDALSMALALLCALLPFIACRPDRKGYLFGGVALFASLNLYQPALSAFLIFMLLEVVAGQIQEKPPRELLLTLAYRIMQCIVVMALYQLLIAPTIEDWLKQHSQTISSLAQLGVIKVNAISFYSYIGKAFNIHWLRCAVPLLLVAGVIPLFAAIRYVRRLPSISGWRCLPWVLGGLLIPILAVLSVTGPMLPLLNPVVLPRVLMGIGALLCAGLVASVLIAQAQGLPSPLVWIQAVLWTLGMTSFASIYGNALGAQKAYEERIVSSLTNDVAALAHERSVQYILIKGSIGLAPITERAAEQFLLINTLIFPYLREADFHTAFYLRYYFQNTPELAREPNSQARVASILSRACDAPVLKVTNSYSLQLVENTVVATFPATSQDRCL
ncbi:glucosyltransferase domain-containing protein [Dyella sp. 20L07]|uniref:glucosyltransferase domain-containing protein n=1 Tax=Dyella sp. 20L07 TaxID=3384240 RepID=UPI003D27F2E5